MLRLAINAIADGIGCTTFTGLTLAFETDHFDGTRIVQGDHFQCFLQMRQGRLGIGNTGKGSFG